MAGTPRPGLFPRRDRDLHHEINEGLDVVESWNRANAVIFVGKGGDIATSRRDEQEWSVLWLRACSPPWSMSTPSWSGTC